MLRLATSCINLYHITCRKPEFGSYKDYIAWQRRRSESACSLSAVAIAEDQDCKVCMPYNISDFNNEPSIIIIAVLEFEYIFLSGRISVGMELHA